MPSIRACGVASALLVALVQLASAQSNWPDRTIVTFWIPTFVVMFFHEEPPSALK